MSNLLVQNIKHTNGTTAQTVDTDGNVDFPVSFQIQQWQLLSSISSNDTRITDWGESTITSQTSAKAGSSMTVSSGQFSFPQTGLYRVIFNMMGGAGSGGQDNYINVRMRVSTDSGSNYTIIKELVHGAAASMAGGNYGDILVNVTNISTFRVDFVTASITGGSSVFGNSASSFAYSTATFERLGKSQ